MRRALFLLPLGLLVSAPLPVPSCPGDMVRIPGRLSCIDRFELPNEWGGYPYSSLSAEPNPDDESPDSDSVVALCAAEGKRPCSRGEWIAACKGPNGSAFPYGPKHVDHACNDDQKWHVPDELKVQRRDPTELARLYQGESAGSRSQCESASGARDMTGSVEEWVRCSDGRGGWCLMGRDWSDGEPCSFTVRRHSPRWHFFQSGGRCAWDPPR